MKPREAWTLGVVLGAVGSGIAALNWLNIARKFALTDPSSEALRATLQWQFWAFTTVVLLLLGVLGYLVAATRGERAGSRAP